MSLFDSSVQSLTLPALESLTIMGVQKQITAMARYATLHTTTQYIKVKFSDKTLLLVSLDDNELFYTTQPIEYIKEIPDNKVGDENLYYHGIHYELTNKNDYQYVLQFYKGTIAELEGEVLFCDYIPATEKKEILSLGWLSIDHRRADSLLQYIDSNSISENIFRRAEKEQEE